MAVTFQQPFSKKKKVFENGCWKVAAEMLEREMKIFYILFLFYDIVFNEMELDGIKLLQSFL